MSENTFVSLAFAELSRHKASGVRQFTIPKLNFECTKYYEVIDWSSTEVTEPPLTRDISDAEIEQFVASGASEVKIIDFPRFPCHTQSIERCVKLVTETSAVVCGSHRATA